MHLSRIHSDKNLNPAIVTLVMRRVVPPALTSEKLVVAVSPTAMDPKSIASVDVTREGGVSRTNDGPSHPDVDAATRTSAYGSERNMDAERSRLWPPQLMISKCIQLSVSMSLPLSNACDGVSELCFRKTAYGAAMFVGRWTVGSDSDRSFCGALERAAALEIS